MDKLGAHLYEIENKLGSTELPPYDEEDKLGWHLNKIEDLIEGGGAGGNIDDVKVNDQSVVSDKVADIKLKTIEGNSIVGEGDVALPTYTPFPNTWRHDTIEHLLTDVNADESAVVGKSYLGEVTNVTKAEGLFNGNAEIVLNIMNGTTPHKVIWCIVSSNNVAPYHWEATFSSGTISAKGWTGYQPELKGSTTADGTLSKILGFDSDGALKKANMPNPELSENILWADLKAKRDAGQLEPGKFYRITDYNLVIPSAYSSNYGSAGHQFDIIVLALENNKLSEEAYAAQHNGDTYFANSNLSDWKLLYCLDNDTNRFSWADSTNGKGVIYRMIDEFENDVYYDFKNLINKTIMIPQISSGRINFEGQTRNCYTFGNFGTGSTKVDFTVYFSGQNCRIRNNTILPHYESEKMSLPAICFGETNIPSLYCPIFKFNKLVDSYWVILYYSGCSYNFINNSNKVYMNGIFNKLENCITVMFASSYDNSHNTFKNAVYVYLYSYCSNNLIENSSSIYLGTTCQKNIIKNCTKINNTDGNPSTIYTANELKNCTIYNSSYIEFRSNGCVENTKIFDANYCDLYNSSTQSGQKAQNFTIHSGITGASSTNRRSLTLTTNLTYSTDIYANNSRSIILDD